MPNKNDRNKETMALEAVENVIISDDIAKIKESLELFFLEWVQCEDDPEQAERMVRVFHYRVISSFLDEIKPMQLR